MYTGALLCTTLRVLEGYFCTCFCYSSDLDSDMDD